MQRSDVFYRCQKVEKLLLPTKKTRGLKNRIIRLNNLNKRDKIRVKPNDIICKVTNDMNKTPEKYGTEPDSVERESLMCEPFRIKLQKNN